MLQQAIPVFSVTNLERTLEFYCGRLGFTLEFQHGEWYAGVRLDGVRFHLSRHAGDGRPGSNVTLIVDDVDAWFAEQRGRGYFPTPDAATLERDPVHNVPTNQTWGMREICVEDPDGNRLCFAMPQAA